MFLNPLMLAGLGGAMLPVVLHLLARSRFRTVDWAAMMFLVGVDPRQRQSTRLKQLILLLLRMAIVGLLAVALARPVVSDSLAAVASGGHVTAVIIVDGSASTTLVEIGKPRSELIRQAAIQILASLHKGDEAAVVVAGVTQKTPHLTTELSKVADEIGAITPAGRANLADALARASDLLTDPEDLNRRLYVICDRQAVSWKEVDAAFRSAWKARADRGTVRTPLVIVPVGSSTGDNLAIEAVAIANPPLVRDQPVDVDVRVRNYGPVRRAGVPVVLSVNGRDVGKTTVDCGPDSTVTARASIRLWETGPQLLTATIAKTPGLNTGLLADDSLDYSIDVNEPTRVLILSGDERQPKSASESYFATIALQPFATSGRHGSDPCKVTVMPMEAATGADLAANQVVILANVATVTPAMASSIEQWVYDGGGLLLAPGSLTRVANVDDRLFRSGAGVLPCGLVDPAQAQPAGLGQLDLSHPALQFLRGRSDLPPTTFGKWFKLSPLRTDARVIASLANGDPFAVECTAGRGRVMALATPLDADWSTLPLTSFYLPFLQNSVRWLAGGTSDRNLPLGSTISYAMTGEVRNAQLFQPDGSTVNLPPQRQGDRTEFRYPDADQPGVYRLRVVTTKREYIVPFVINGPSEESNLSPMQAKDWDTLSRELDATVLNTPKQSLAETLKISRAGHEVWAALVLGVIALALGESWLAGRWSKQD